MFARPRVKPENRPLRLASGAIRIGGLIYGVAAEIEDPSGAVWTLLGAMDGTRSIDELARLLQSRFPHEDPAAVRDAILDLCRSGYIEDAVQQGPVLLSERERERYSRSQAFYRWIDLTPRTDQWYAQHRLQASAVTVVGLGGMGGATALALGASGVGDLHCVDMDHVELSNLNRQTLYTEADLGQRKVDAAVGRLRQLNSDITVTGEHRHIQGPGDLRDLVAGCDVFVLGADTPYRIQFWTNDECLRSGTPWVDGGYAGPRVTATAYVPGQGGCFRCARMADRDRLPTPVDPDVDPDAGLAGNPVTATAAGVAGNLSAHLVLGLITGVPPVIPGTVLGIDLGSLENQFRLTVDRHPDCSACAGVS